MIKKIVLWLVRVLGVDVKIRHKERIHIARQMGDISYWFSNHDRYGKLYPFIAYLSFRIKYGWGLDGCRSRETWDLLQLNDVHDPINGWSDFKFNIDLGCLTVQPASRKKEEDKATQNEHEKRFPGNEIHPTAVIGPNVTIGTGNYIGPYCVIGMPGEHREKWGIDKGVIIGNNNRITGHVTIDSGTDESTIITSECMLMKHSHVGHDAFIGDNVTLSCGAKIGGHAIIGNHCNIGLNAVVHQHKGIPEWCMIGMGAVVPLKVDLAPGHTYVGNPVELLGRNRKAPAEVGDAYYVDHFNMPIEFCKPINTTRKEAGPDESSSTDAQL